jgi:hypothetical protein
VQSRIKEYRKAVKAANKELEDLQQRAAELADAAGERVQLQARLAFIEERSTGLMNKRETLGRRFGEAMYEDDTEQLESISQQRSRIDEELEQVEAEEMQLQEQLKQHTVDPEALADVYIKAELVALPEHKKLLAEIETLLKAEETAIRGIVEDIHATLPRTHLKGAHIEAARLRNDPKHAARERREERNWKRREEAIAEEYRYRGIVQGGADISDTDQALAAMGYVRSVYPGRQNEAPEQGKAKPWDKVHEEEIVLSR